MKKALIALVASSLILCGFVKSIAPIDILSELGMTEQEAKRNIWSSFEKSRIYLSSGILSKRVSLKTLAFTSRKELIKEFGKYVKQYVSSEAFSRQYDEYRAKQAPVAPTGVGQGLNRIEEENRKQLKYAEERLRMAKPEDKPMYEKDVAFWKKQLEPYEDHNSKAYAAQQKNAQALQDLFAMANKNKKVEMDASFPEGANNMVRQRLQSFLELSASVDYNAALKKDLYSNKMLFVNPDYERKPYAWKFCYRLGKETVDELRLFAKEWLAELKQSK
jgi:hypothetical protein